MTPAEIIRDAEDMARNYPDDRLRLTGAEIMALVAVVREQALEAVLAEIWKDYIHPDNVEVWAADRNVRQELTSAINQLQGKNDK